MWDITKYLTENIEDIKRLKAEGKTHLEVAQYLSTPERDITAIQVGYFCRQNRIVSLGARVANLGERNPCKRPEVRNKISNTVSQLWSDGVYDSRVNGMLGRLADEAPNFSYGKWTFREKYLYYLDGEPVCERCGESLSNCKWDVHHIDEDHDNVLLTNLQGLCVRCHQKFHFDHEGARYKQPYITVGRKFLLECAHFLPDYPGKCFWTHGHRYEVTIQVRRRIDPDTGMVLDFHDFKDIVHEHIENNLDHTFLNDFLINPTSERFLMFLWLTLSKYLKGIDCIELHESRDTTLKLTAKDMNELARCGIIENEWFKNKSIETIIDMEGHNEDS